MGSFGGMGAFASMMSGFREGPSYAREYDPEVEDQLDQWEEAKSQKDFSTSDSIRQGLRDRGISPSKERPQYGGVEHQIQQWQRARQARDYGRSDRIRESLRAQGVEPDQASSGFPGLPPFMAATAMKGGPYGGFGAGGNGKGGGKPTSRSKPQPSLSSMDADTIEELNQWFAAKDEKNYAVADSIRETLRAKGIEPANCQKPGSAGLDDEMSEELRQWFEARDEKNWSVADSIRERLRAKGVEPSQCQRPDSGSTFGKAASFGSAGRSSPYSAGRSGAFDPATEAKLDQWWKCKQDKDYGTADKIRAELRDQGIEPDQHRPRK